MADNTTAKNYLEWAETKLSHVDNMPEINAIINEISLKLNKNLWSNNLFIDQDIADHFLRISNKLEPVWGELITNVKWAIRNINANLASPALDPAQAWNWPARANLTNKRNDYQHIVDDITTDAWVAKEAVRRRYREYTGLNAFATSFNLDNTPIPDITVNTTAPGLTPLMNLNTHLSNTAAIPHTTILGTTYHANYSICDENWNKLRQDWTDYIIEIWWVERRIRGMNITAGWMLDLHALDFDPRLTDFPQEITLSISATYNNNDVRNALEISNTNIIRNKTFKLKLNDWSIELNRNNRLSEFNRYNNSLPRWHKIENIVQTNFEWNRHDLERKALAKILEKNWGTQYATLNDAQKEDLYQIIRNSIRWIPPRLYFDYVLARENIDTEVNRFNEFRDWFVDNGRDWNKGDNIKNRSNYTTFIHNNVSSEVWNFISSRLDHYLWNIRQERFLKSELTRFINDIENNKLDNDATIYNDINNYAASNAHQMDKKARFNRHNIGWWFRDIWRRSDTNYMRFFSWSSTSLHWETVNIHTNTGPERTSAAEPLKYDMDVNVSWRNSIEVEIKIEWEREPIRIKSGEPAALVRKIMRDWRIRYWKARAHMWFNVYKAMIQMAKDNNMSLQYRNNPGDNHTRFIDINDWNIVVRDVDRLTALAPSVWRIIFSQENFINFNRFNRTGANDNASLRTGIDELWKHFTLAMNQLHDQYRHWVEKKFWTRFNSRSKMSLPTSFWSSPIKKLLNFRDTLDFDFNTTVTSKWKNINIDFQKNKFIVNMDWLEKPIESKDLWKILNTRQKWVRIFDWKERDILEWVYSNLINKLRENWRIANTDFWVRDNITWNMYVLDMDWRFWVIARENLISEWSPLRSWEYWRLDHDILDRNTVDWFEHSSSEEKELMRNPFLMQRFVKSMNKRLWLR